MLSIYFAAMIFLNGFVLWRSRNGIRIGMPDFTIFYTAARILHQGRGLELYDSKLQEEVQRSFSPVGFQKRGSLLPYNHPPFEAVLFLPLARLSYLEAYFLWLAVNVSLLCSLPYILRPHFPNLGKESFLLWLAACFAFFPNFVALMQGQDSIVILFCYCMAYASFRTHKEGQMGAWLGIALCKFHLVLPFALPLAFSIRKRFVLAFAVVASALVLAGTAVVGVKGWVAYPAFVWASDSKQSYAWKIAVGNSANLRGVIFTLISSTHSGLRMGLVLFFSGLLFCGALFSWRRALGQGDDEMKSLAFAIALGVTVLLSYHLYLHDLSLLFLAILIAWETNRSPRLNMRARNGMFLCLAILSCTPVYLLLALRYKQLEIIGGVILALISILWVQMISGGKSQRSTLAML